jgi:glycine/D-amino acid oxidase-like deaminating enzyme
MAEGLRVAVVGGGLAGAALAWRLSGPAHRVAVDLFTGPDRPDATSASGGLVRGFETDPARAVAAADSLAELLASPVLRDWAGYRELGSLYLLPDAGPAATAELVERRIRGSVNVLDGRSLAARFPLRQLPDGTVAVAESRAGVIDPARLRSRLLAALPDRVSVHREPVVRVGPGAALHPAGGRTRRYDAVVLATGAWTPALLARSGLNLERLRTKQIQYLVCPVELPGLPPFSDEGSGLYGRPLDDGRFLLGLPTDHWSLRPEEARPDPELAVRTLVVAGRLLRPAAPAGPVERIVAAVDCYHDPAGFALRRVGGADGLFTFTGGSGGAAKAVFTTSRAAAAELTAAARPELAAAG